MENTNEHKEMKKELELFRVAFQKLLDHSEQRDIKVDAMVKKVDDMYEVFNNGTFLVTVTKWIFGLTIASGGFYIMIRDIIHAQNN